MWLRLLLVLAAALLGGNGVHMLFAPEHWYHSLDSVTHTGPFNPHFVRDIGCAYLASAVALACGAWRPAWVTPGALAALTFLGPHAGVHLWESLSGHASAAHMGPVDIVGVYGPPLLAFVLLIASLRRTPPRHHA